MKRLVDGVLVDMTPEEIAARQAEENAPAPLPNEIDLWRIRVILAEDGTLAAIDAAVAALDDAQAANRGIKQRWLGPVTPQKFVNDSPLVQGMIATFSGPLGLTQEYIDSVRQRAAALPE